MTQFTIITKPHEDIYIWELYNNDTDTYEGSGTSVDEATAQRSAQEAASYYTLNPSAGNVVPLREVV